MIQIRLKQGLLVTFGSLAFLICGLSVIPANGQVVHYTQKVLHTFTGGIVDGAGPRGGIIRDALGNLYGTTSSGGPAGCDCGVVFKLDKAGQETILHSFTGLKDGYYPNGNLVQDEDGILYGTTRVGGDPDCNCGTVYKMDPATGAFSVLYTFTGSQQYDPGPHSGLIRDKAGNLYGTTSGQGKLGFGTVFRIDPQGAYKLLHSFAAWDGLSPDAALTLDDAGNLYGVTTGGGSYGDGVVFKLDSRANVTVLYNFTGNTDGWDPRASLVVDKDGSLYGTTYQGSNSPPQARPGGTVFKLDKSGKYTLLQVFTGLHDIGGSASGGLTIDRVGNVYGTTTFDGAYGAGSVFMVDTTGRFRTVYSFKRQADGAYPFASVTLDAEGNLYGTAETGGEFAGGVVFELSPK